MRSRWSLVLGAALTLGGRSEAVEALPVEPQSLPPRATGWTESGFGMVRGVTVGPIESALHPDRGYGSEACARSLDEAKRMGATWVSFTPFGRVWDLRPTGVSPTFEAPYSDNRVAVRKAITQAHQAGLKVMLVPHLWVESGGWRALIDPGSDEAWSAWSRSYGEFVIDWARLARDEGVEMFSVGVELRSWLTTARAPSFADLIHQVRAIYPGLLTYAGNWDDVENTVILGELDVIGVNAFFPLAEKEGASRAELMQGGRKVRARLAALARSWRKPVLFTEFGYTTRADPAIKPWEWPDSMKHVKVDEIAQAEAYYALLSGSHRRAVVRRLLRLARVRRSPRHVPGSGVGLLPSRESRRAGAARRVPRLVGGGWTATVGSAAEGRGVSDRDLLTRRFSSLRSSRGR